MSQIPVNRDRLVEIYLELARQNTPPKHERAASELAKKRLEALGFECYWDDAGEKVGGDVGNLICFKKGTIAGAPPIFFSSHFDTVEPTPDIKLIIEDDIIHSDGRTLCGADDKCGVAPILEAMYLLHEQKIPHGDIQLLLTICEEIGLTGAAMMDPKHIKSKYGFVLDSGPPIGAFIYQAPTHDVFEVWIRGKASHAGAAPEDGISAIVIAAKAISQMRLGRIDPETTANIGVIQGGNATNIIPDEVYLKCEARSRNKDRLALQMQHMTDLFETTAAQMGGTCEIKVHHAYQGYELKMDDTVLKIAEKATEAIGLDFVLRVTGGGSDGNIFNAGGFPTTVLGCGMQNIHRHDEFVKISDMIKSAELVISITQTAAGWRE